MDGRTEPSDYVLVRHFSIYYIYPVTAATGGATYNAKKRPAQSRWAHRTLTTQLQSCGFSMGCLVVKCDRVNFDERLGA